jgi:hypothetical protein
MMMVLHFPCIVKNQLVSENERQGNPHYLYHSNTELCHRVNEKMTQNEDGIDSFCETIDTICNVVVPVSHHAWNR